MRCDVEQDPATAVHNMQLRSVVDKEMGDCGFPIPYS